jgi:hypothetical protein
MKTEYNYTVKKINERSTVCTVSAEGVTPFDIEVPIVSNDFEPVFAGSEKPEEKTAIRQEARTNFKESLRKYILDFLVGKELEEKAKEVTISPTLQAIEGQSFTINVKA